MPVKIEKVKGRKCYKVSTPNGVKAKCTSKRNAERQRRLINAAENNPGFKAKLRDKMLRS